MAIDETLKAIRKELGIGYFTGNPRPRSERELRYA